jgi:uncharacterized Zn-finger protein
MKGEKPIPSVKLEKSTESLENSSLDNSIYESRKKGNGAKLFVCPFKICQKEYSNKCRLDIHVRTHVSLC